MSQRPENRSPLDELVREAKADLEPRVSDERWSAVEDRILARMALEEKSSLAQEVNAPPSRGRVLRIGAAVLAAAAAIALFVKNEPSTGIVSEGASSSADRDLTASALRESVGPGVVSVGGLPAAAGHVLRTGDVLEANGARAVLERARKVTWLLEAGNAEGSQLGRARVKSAGESLVLGLDDGAIEAQVTPVPSGEAFAVDIASGSSLVRVAVHGTHLRVSRSGSRVVVDLTEGVVSIGTPPRSGSTYGTLVTAPSHVEFDAADLDHTLRVDHAPSAVRAAVPLASHDTFASGNAAPRADAPPATPIDTSAPAAPATVPRPTAVSRPAADPSRVETAGKTDSVPALPPREAIAAAVRACAAQRSRPENVRVTVSSSLKLKIASGGDVETARFDPPLLPEIQACAANAIYKAKLQDAAGDSVTIPIDFSY
jgi:ferric-dicitrate binding protein FerR (iron transport regulator)